MGKFDIYSGIQLKVGDCDSRTFNIGDEVPIDDGVYLEYSGAVVVQEGKLKYFIEDVYDKWGNLINIKEAIEARNPIEKALASIMTKGGERIKDDE